MATPTPKTDQQRAVEFAALCAQREEQMAALTTPAGWARLVAAAAWMPAARADNCLLITDQVPGASEVASYGAWRARGRQVRRGEKAITIMGSRLVAEPFATEQAGQGIGPVRLDAAGRQVREVTFPLRVFDLSQTDPIKDAPTTARSAPGEQVDLYARVAAHLAGQAVTLRRLVLPGRADGLCRKLPPAGAPLAPESRWVVDVVVDCRVAGEHAAHAAVHQVAHITAGHLEATGGDYVTHRGRHEVEAQAAAHIVCARAGMEVGEVPTGYDPAWMGAATPADLAAAATAALAAAATLATRLGIGPGAGHRAAA